MEQTDSPLINLQPQEVGESLEQHNRDDVTGIIKSVFSRAAEKGIRPVCNEVGRHDSIESTSIEQHILARFEEEMLSDLSSETVEYRQKNIDRFVLELWKRATISKPKPSIKISEIVVASRGIGKDDRDFAGAIISFENLESGQLFKLNDVIPAECHLVPSALDHDNLDVSTYTGMESNSNDDIEYRPTSSQICYGQVNTNLGLLGALHEIGHSWQHTAKEDNSNYVDAKLMIQKLNIYREHRVELARLDTPSCEPSILIQALYAQRIIPIENRRKFIEAMIEELTEELKSYGIEFDEETVTYMPEILVKGCEDYVWSERQAWASAIKAFREIDRLGMTPENAIEIDPVKYAHLSLATYQDSIDKAGIKLRRKFTDKYTALD